MCSSSTPPMPWTTPPAGGSSAGDRVTATGGGGAVGWAGRGPLAHRQVVERYTERIGDYLGHGGLDALAVAAAAHGDLHLAVDRDLDGRGLGRQASHGDPGRLDVEAEPEPEQPPLVERLGLELAEAVVVDHVSCLLERLGDRDGVVDQTRRGGVREIARSHPMAAPEHA